MSYRTILERFESLAQSHKASRDACIALARSVATATDVESIAYMHRCMKEARGYHAKFLAARDCAVACKPSRGSELATSEVKAGLTLLSNAAILQPS